MSCSARQIEALNSTTSQVQFFVKIIFCNYSYIIDLWVSNDGPHDFIFNRKIYASLIFLDELYKGLNPEKLILTMFSLKSFNKKNMNIWLIIFVTDTCSWIELNISMKKILNFPLIKKLDFLECNNLPSPSPKIGPHS